MSGSRSVRVIADTRGATSPTFSIVLCTVGRSVELRTFLRSLHAQHASRESFELIVVDQNPSPSVVRDALQSAGLGGRFLHLSCDRVSLSFARNQALRFVRGAIVAFPDDDCEYPPDLLSAIAKRFRTAAHHVSGMCCHYPGDRIAPGTQLIHPVTSMGQVISFSLFLFSHRFPGGLPCFDERLGVGAFFGAGEETELIVRALAPDARLEVVHDMLIKHPLKHLDSIERELSYGRGFGALANILIRRGDIRSIAVTVRLLGGPLFRAAAALAVLRPRDARLSLAAFRGRVEGFVRYRPGRHVNQP